MSCAEVRGRSAAKVPAAVAAAGLLSALVLAVWSTAALAADYGADFTYKTSGQVLSVAVTPDGSLIAVGTSAGVALLNSSGTCLWSYATSRKVVDVCAVPPGFVYALTRDDSYFKNGELLAFQKDGTKLWSLSVSGGSTVSVSHDQVYLVLTRESWLGWCDEIDCWSESKDDWIWRDSGGEPLSGAAAISAAGTLVVYGVSEDPREYSLTKGDGGLRLLDGPSGESLWKYTGTGGGPKDVYAVAISGDGRYLAAGHSGSSTVHFFSSSGGTPLWTYTAGPVKALALSFDGNRLVVGAGDKVYLLGREGHLLWSKTQSGLCDVAVSADGGVIVVGGGQQVVLYRDLQPASAQAIANAAEAIQRAKSKGVVVTPAETLLAQARTAYEQGQYASARDLAGRAMNTAFTLSNQRTAAVTAIDRAAAAVAQALSAGIPCATAQSRLTQARTLLDQADYERAKSLAEEAEKSASTLTAQRSTALTMISDAEAAIETERGAGYDVGRAESLLEEARKAFADRGYEAALTLADQARSWATDIDHDGVPNADDRFPTVSNLFIYGGGAGAVTLLVGLLAFSAMRARRRREMWIMTLSARTGLCLQALEDLRRLSRGIR
ncbi:MAG: hypothetical protein K6U08_00630 [Firmicutes bacterium]|nr:hypothetical protein [Bacillota bacterium]